MVHTVRSSILFSLLYNRISFSEAVKTFRPPLRLRHAILVNLSCFMDPQPLLGSGITSSQTPILPSPTAFYPLVYAIHYAGDPLHHHSHHSYYRTSEFTLRQPTELFVYLRSSSCELCSVLPGLWLLPVPPHQVFSRIRPIHFTVRQEMSSITFCVFFDRYTVPFDSK